MNDIEHYNHQFEEFKRRFSGRNDFQILQEALESGGIESYQIYRFLMNKFPDAIISKAFVPIVKTRTDKEEVGREAKTKLEEINFVGWLELDWKGKRTVIREVRIRSNFGFTSRAIIAVQDRANFEDLLNEVQRFLDSESKLKKEIRVANGRDIPIPNASWDELFLPASMKAAIRNTVESFFTAREHYRKMKLPYKRGVLLIGSPGTGKSQTIKTIAANIEEPVVALQIRDDVQESDVERTFSIAERLSPALVVLEDIDKLLNATKVSLAYLLNIIDGLWSKEGILIVASSNEPEKLNPAILKRPSRFDRIWEFALPDYENRLRMLRFRSGHFFSESALDRCANESQGLTMAFVQEVVVSALLTAIHSGTHPNDELLFESLAILKTQERYCTKLYEKGNNLVDVGFVAKT